MSVRMFRVCRIRRRDNCNKATIEYKSGAQFVQIAPAILGTLAKNTYFCPTNIE